MDGKEAVKQAIIQMVEAGERPYSHNVPEKAKAILIQQGGGMITYAEASPVVKQGILDLQAAGELEASALPAHTWKLLKP